MNKIKRKFTSWVLVLVMVVLIMPQMSLAMTGSGTAEDPFIIATAQDLIDFRNAVNNGNTIANAVMTADIDLKGDDSNQWTPIGGAYSWERYIGTFDGRGHTISGLYIKNRTSDNQGLFSAIENGGIVKNLTVSGSVTGNNYVGCIVGYNFGGTVEGCSSIGNIKGTIGVGGVAGYNLGTIKYCQNSCDVTGTYNVGGIDGQCDGQAVIQYCYNEGNISSDGYNVGGISGAYGTIEYCYNKGDISSSDHNVGGIVGYAIGTINYCYNIGTISGYSNSVGGIAGSIYSNPVNYCYSTGTVVCNNPDSSAEYGGVVGYYSNENVTNSYYNSSGISGGNNLGTGVEISAFANEATFADWDFQDTWVINDLLGRPILKSIPETLGTGAEDDPYQIPDKETLEVIRYRVNNGNIYEGKHFQVTADIDLNGSEDNQWEPISDFKGNFDGGSHTISGLYINNTSADQGLFGRLSDGGTVKNLTVSGSITGQENIGGLVGYNQGGTISNCCNAGDVRGNFFVGGIVGYLDSGEVINCCNTGNVIGEYGSTYVGGLVGFNKGKVINSYNIGTVSGNIRFGQISGVNSESGIINNTYYLTGITGIGLGSGEATEKTSDEFASGQVTYLLNNGVTDGTQTWYQNIGSDSYPKFTGATVYSYNDYYYNSLNRGDIHLDGKVDNLDAALLLKYVSSMTTLNDDQLSVADVNGDNDIDITDVNALLNSIE